MDFESICLMIFMAELESSAAAALDHGVPDCLIHRV